MKRRREVPDQPALRVEITEPAARDFDEIVDWTVRRFGGDAAIRYSDLIARALQDLESDPFRMGSRAIPGPPAGLRGYHLSHSRKQARSSLGYVRKPRHMVVYRVEDQIVYVLRFIHDVRELARHIDAG